MIQQAPYEPALASFDELENKFPFFKRLSDYYKDAHFAHEELAGLQSEIVQLKEVINKNNAVLEQLCVIDALCEKAIAENKSIWVFCD